MAHLQRLRVEGNGFLVGIRLTRFIPGFAQVDKGFLPDFPQREVLRQFFIALRQPLVIELFHRMTGCDVEHLSPGGE